MPGFILQKFDKNDVFELISQIPDEEFMIQWGGFGFKWQLSADQFESLFALAGCDLPLVKLFKLIDLKNNCTAGHIELLRIDYKEKEAWLGRVLAFRNYRGTGAGSKMILLTLGHVFNEMNFNTVRLNVYDFNLSAVSAYEKAGFVKEQLFENANILNGKTYSHYCMKLSRENFTVNL